MIVLDTNVVSEVMRPAPAERVVRWLGARPVAELYTTSITEAEVLHGISRLPAGRRRNALDAAARAMFDEDFDGRILPFGSEAARFYARIAAERARAGHPVSQFDAQIAAIARAVGATVAARNVADFQGCGIDVVDPWSDAER